MPTLCRSCFALFDNSFDAPCPSCGDGLIVSHPELERLHIAHLDCDSFYASVEKRDRPELTNKPVLVGGQKRGVVMAACYVARRYGVYSAMPMFKALRQCPNAVVIRPDMQKYVKIGHEIREMMRSVTPLVEPISIDEAFLDLTGTERLHSGSAAQTVARLVSDIRAAQGITVSVGLSHNKFLAKLASALEKPQGFTLIGEAETVSYLATLPVARIWGVGAVLQKRLERDGISRIGDLQRIPEAELVRRYGNIGERLARLSNGRDSRRVEPSTSRKSLSSETTFAEDVSDAGGLKRILWRQAEKVSSGAKKEGIGGRTVTLKLKTASFRIRTRARTLPHPTQLADVIYAAAAPLLDREADGTAFRLLGVGLSGIVPADQCDPIDLADPKAQRRKRVETTLDKLRNRFGANSIIKGRRL